MTLQEVTDLTMSLAKEKGWGAQPGEINVGEKIALIHSEVTEAYEAYRKNNIDGKHGFSEELADVIVRTLHLCGIFNINIEAEITKKMKDNQLRTWDRPSLNEQHT